MLVSETSTHNLTVWSVNVNSLRGKIDTLRANIETLNPDLILIQETKISPKTHGHFDIDGYVLFRRDRNENGGGVGLYCRSEFNPSAINTRIPDDLEVLPVAFTVAGSKLVAVSIYRSPGLMCESDFVDGITTVLANTQHAGDFICAGDTNMCWLSPKISEFLSASFEPFSITQVVTSPTHKARAIDHCYIPSHLVDGHVLELRPPIEKFHNLVSVSMRIPVQRQRQQARARWRLRQADWMQYVVQLFTLNLVNLVVTAVSAEAAWHVLRDSILRCANNTIPKSANSNRRQRRWKSFVSDELKELIINRDDAFKKARKFKTDKLYSEYVSLRDKATKKVRTDKLEFFTTQFANASDSSTFWKTFHTMCGKNSGVVPPLQAGNGSVVTDNSAIAELLADHFHDTCSSRPSPVFDRRLVASFPDSDLCDITFVRNYILSLPTRKSEGIDNIPCIFLKQGVDAIAPALCVLINRCLREMYFPSQLKTAIIIPLPKISNPYLPTHFRPISILPICSKALEKHILHIIRPYITPKLSCTQFGFRQKCSTTDALMFFDQYVAQLLETFPTVCAVYVDVAKAFDTVNIDLLLSTLRDEYSMPDYLCNVLQSFLKGRFATVRCNGAISQSFDLQAGIAQGSILGPTLFTAFVNSVNFIDVSAGAKIISYADDLVYIRGFKSANDVLAVQTDLDLIAKHITTNKLLSINNNKTHFQIFKRNHSKSVVPPSLSLEDKQIPVSSNVKYLGVTLDDHLTYSVHTQNQCAKLKKQFGYIYRQLRRCVSRKSLVSIYTSLIRVSLLYACEVTYPVNVHDCKQLEKVQRYACRLITGNFAQDYPYTSLLSDLKLRSLWQTVFTRRLTLLHSYISGYRYKANGLIIMLRDSNTRSSTRFNHSNAILIPTFKFDTLAKSPLVSTATAYNLLPSNITLLNKQKFKSAVSKAPIISDILSKVENLRSQIVHKVNL